MMAEAMTKGSERAGGVRTCVGCSKRAPAEELVRVVLGPTGALADDAAGEVLGAAIAIDLAGSAFGRGAHVHAQRACLERAARGGFARVFKTRVATDLATLGRELVRAADRRILGLLSGAARARQVVVGSDAVVAALQEGEGALVIVAADAAAAAGRAEVRGAVDRGRAIVWGVKRAADGSRRGQPDLGVLFGRDEVAVCAVLQAGVAKAIARAYGASLPFRSEAWSSPEVR